MKHIKVLVFAGLLITALVVTIMLRPTSAAAVGPSASGHGTILLQDTEGKTVRRQFSFNARQMPDGTVRGSACFTIRLLTRSSILISPSPAFKLLETAPVSAAQLRSQVILFSPMSLTPPSLPFLTTVNQVTATTRSAKFSSIMWLSQVLASLLVLMISRRYQSKAAMSR